MDAQTYWDTLYRTHAPDSVSWFQPHLEISIGLIERAAPDRSAAIIEWEAANPRWWTIC